MKGIETNANEMKNIQDDPCDLRELCVLYVSSMEEWERKEEEDTAVDCDDSSERMR